MQVPVVDTPMSNMTTPTGQNSSQFNTRTFLSDLIFDDTVDNQPSVDIAEGDDLDLVGQLLEDSGDEDDAKKKGKLFKCKKIFNRFLPQRRIHGCQMASYRVSKNLNLSFA